MISQDEHSMDQPEVNGQNPRELILRSLQSIETLQNQESFSIFAVVQSVSHAERGAYMDLQVLDEHGNHGYIAVPKILLAHPVPDLSCGAVVHFTGLTRGDQEDALSKLPVMVCTPTTQIKILDVALDGEDQPLMPRLRSLETDLIRSQRILRAVSLVVLGQQAAHEILPGMLIVVDRPRVEPTFEILEYAVFPLPHPNLQIERQQLRANQPAGQPQDLQEAVALPEPDQDQDFQAESSDVEGTRGVINHETYVSLQELEGFELPEHQGVSNVSLVVGLQSLSIPIFQTVPRVDNRCPVRHRLERARRRCRDCANSSTVYDYGGSYEARARVIDQSRQTTILRFQNGPVGTAFFSMDGQEFYRTYSYESQAHFLDSIFLITVEISRTRDQDTQTISKEIVAATRIQTQVEADQISTEMGDRFARLSGIVAAHAEARRNIHQPLVNQPNAAYLLGQPRRPEFVSAIQTQPQPLLLQDQPNYSQAQGLFAAAPLNPGQIRGILGPA